ncbi:lipid asymmetry maintenance protein MlaB [Vibrio tubiashii]|uniref:STAS domain-containing protein n=1 Tax=Vibrio tubiashii TaxID=29498 RepID=UPI001EFC45A3|nr:lipid asymmetry maintenance protein MlaB [Vibrio tubiashii]MCG9577142.1 lipid asymmetry maintenance protein MlaB [Vibrio tubiashii]
MMEPKWQKNHDGQYSLTGDLNRDTVPKLWQSLQTLQLASERVEVSLEGLTRIDSAGMVMLIHLIENAKKQNCHIMLSFVPEQLRTLFQLSNVDELIAGHLKNTTGVNCG